MSEREGLEKIRIKWETGVRKGKETRGCKGWKKVLGVFTGEVKKILCHEDREIGI
jgi:hypothetical protein